MERNELLSPLAAEDWADNIQHIAQRLGNPLNIHKMIAHNPLLMEAYTPLRYHVVQESSLSDRQREILILRVAHNIESEYEWSHHVERGQAAGLTLQEIEQVKNGSDADCWSSDEKFILDCVDQMLVDQQMTTGTASGLLETVGKEGVLDVVFTVAVYFALGSLLKTFDVPIES